MDGGARRKSAKAVNAHRKRAKSVDLVVAWYQPVSVSMWHVESCKEVDICNNIFEAHVRYFGHVWRDGPFILGDGCVMCSSVGW